MVHHHAQSTAFYFILRQRATVPHKCGVIRHDGYSSGKALSNEHAVKRITMMPWKPTKRQCIGTVVIQQFKPTPVGFHDGIKRNIQFADGGFDHDFCNTDGTDQDDIGFGLQLISLGLRKFLRLRKRPQKNMGIDQYLHLDGP